MPISNRKPLTNLQAAHFSRAAESPRQRQYEALRAFFINEDPSREVAQRFHYSPGAFRVLCSRFRHDRDFRAAFFQTIPHGPQTTPARDRVRELAVAMRKQNLSVYDSQRDLAAASQFFHLDALSSMVGLKVDFDLQLTIMAGALYRLMAEKFGGVYQKAQAKKTFRNLLDVSATVAITENEVTVTLDKRAHNPYLVASRLTDRPTPMPWFGDKLLQIRFA